MKQVYNASSEKEVFYCTIADLLVKKLFYHNICTVPISLIIP